MKAIMILIILVTGSHGTSLSTTKIEFDNVADCNKVLALAKEDIRVADTKIPEWQQLHLVSGRCVPL